MRLVAHRGFAAEAPENTLRAVQWATPRADAVEVDVRRSATGDAVVIHDETVDRVTDGSGRVADHTRAELAALSVLGTDEGVPTLAEVFDAVPPTVAVNVECKERRVVGPTLRVVADADHEVFVSSFDPAVLRACRAVDADLPLASLFTEASALARVRDLDAAYAHPHHSLCDRAFVDRAHALGVEVNAWTVADADRARALAEAGVDGIVADRSDLFHSPGRA